VRKHFNAITLAIPFLLCLGVASLGAQDPQPPAQIIPPEQLGAKKGIVPLQVEVVVSKYQGEKRTSSVPYVLSVNAAQPPFSGRPSQIRIGANVPVPTLVGEQGSPKLVYQSSQFVGTQIDCSATVLEGGRFEINLSIEDSASLEPPVGNASTKADEPPILRTFRSRNQLVLRDGQSSQFTAAADRISGEVIRVDVTPSVVK
jgi:hypothetical protein